MGELGFAEFSREKGETEMSESIAFFAGLIAMGILWYWTDYLDSGSAYRRGYRQALEDEILIRKRMSERSIGEE